MKKSISASLAFAASACASQTPAPIAMPAPQIAMVPYPAPKNDVGHVKGSLWTEGSTSLLSMRRAAAIGDLLTVVVNMNDQASLQNSLSRNRSSSNDLSIGALFGLTDAAATILPNGATLSPAIDIDQASTLSGTGAVDRSEQVAFRLACRVVGIEPSGNLIIQGYQQIRVSHEIRYLEVSGVIRAQDITRNNTVTYDKIADAQLAYVSTGEAIGPVKRSIGAKLIDRVVPF